MLGCRSLQYRFDFDVGTEQDQNLQCIYRPHPNHCPPISCLELLFLGRTLQLAIMDHYRNTGSPQGCSTRSKKLYNNTGKVARICRLSRGILLYASGCVRMYSSVELNHVMACKLAYWRRTYVPSHQIQCVRLAISLILLWTSIIYKNHHPMVHGSGGNVQYYNLAIDWRRGTS